MKRADIQFAALWALTAALGAAFVRAELAVAPPPAAPVYMPTSVPSSVGSRPLPKPLPKPVPASPFAVGGHRKIDAPEVQRLIQAGELSDHEAAEYGGAP